MLKDIIAGFVSLFQPEAAKEDRRKIIRLRCRFEIFIVTLEEVYPATVIDMGLKGLRVKSQEPLKVGTQVSLVYRGGTGEHPETTRANLERDKSAAFDKGVLCDVAWSTKDKYAKACTLGVTYNDTPRRMGKSWIKKILREIGFDEDTIFQRRKIVRVISSIPCTLTSGRTDWRGRVINMGAGGALFQGDHQMNVGQTVSVVIGPYKKYKALQVRGEVMTERYEQSTNGWLHGIRFVAMESEQTTLLGKYVVSLLKEQIAK
jgi:PilZ domain